MTLRLAPQLLLDANKQAQRCKIDLRDFLEQAIECFMADRRDQDPKAFRHETTMPQTREEMAAEQALTETMKLSEVKPENERWDGELLASTKAEEQYE
jgi:hypothetical protein